MFSNWSRQKLISSIAILALLATAVIYAVANYRSNADTPVGTACLAPLPTIELTVKDASASEGTPADDTASIIVKYTGSYPASPKELTVDIAVAGTAKYQSDYSLQGANYANERISLSFSRSEPTEKTITFVPIDDTAVDTLDPEDIKLRLAPKNDLYKIGTQKEGTLYVYDNDVSLPKAWVEATDASASEPTQDPGSFTFGISKKLSSDITLNYTIATTPASSTATPGKDYEALSGSVTIPKGSKTAAAQVKPLQDADANESDETVSVALTASSSYSLAESQKTATVSISDKAALPIVSISPQSMSVQVPAEGHLTLTRTGSTAKPLSVSLKTSGDAVLLTDYSLASSTGVNVPLLTIPQGSTSLEFVIQPSLMQGTKTAILSIAESTAYTIGTPTGSTITLKAMRASWLQPMFSLIETAHAAGDENFPPCATLKVTFKDVKTGNYIVPKNVGVRAYILEWGSDAPYVDAPDDLFRTPNTPTKILDKTPTPYDVTKKLRYNHVDDPSTNRTHYKFEVAGDSPDWKVVNVDTRLDSMPQAVSITVNLEARTVAISDECSYQLKGVVTTPLGAPASNATVTLAHIPRIVGSNSSFTTSVKTDAKGAYLTKLPYGGSYQIHAVDPKYERAVGENQEFESSSEVIKAGENYIQNTRRMELNLKLASKNRPPVVKLTQPTKLTYQAGKSVPLSAKVTLFGKAKIKTVKFIVTTDKSNDVIFTKTLTKEPFNAQWDPGNKVGAFVIQVIATDSTGAEGDSAKAIKLNGRGTFNLIEPVSAADQFQVFICVSKLRVEVTGKNGQPLADTLIQIEPLNEYIVAGTGTVDPAKLKTGENGVYLMTIDFPDTESRRYTLKVSTSYSTQTKSVIVKRAEDQTIKFVLDE